jgi:hypothetical protein
MKPGRYFAYPRSGWSDAGLGRRRATENDAAAMTSAIAAATP